MTVETNLATLARFYAAFARQDGDTMSDCYREDARFRDPVFELAGPEVGAMWRMLCSRGKDLRVEYTPAQADALSGSTDWQAWYSFSATGRAVHNKVHSSFVFDDGKIVEQVDRFDFWRWSRQALGTPGLLLGWSPLLKNKVRSNASRALQQFMTSGRRAD
jgi:ketosteroid isomerase-like protein